VKIQRNTFGDPAKPTNQTISYGKDGERFTERAVVLVVVSEGLKKEEIAALLDGAMTDLTRESAKLGGEGASLPKESKRTEIQCGGECDSLGCRGHDVAEFVMRPEKACGPNSLRDALFTEVERLRSENGAYRSVLASVGADYESTEKLVREMAALRDVETAANKVVLKNDDGVPFVGELNGTLIELYHVRRGEP
jgi:hypothetical protein